MLKRPDGQIFDHAQSQRLYDLIKAKPNHCFSNAVRAIAFLSEAEYVEGYVVLPAGGTEPFLHGWLEKDGKIIDPSLPDGNRAYFPADRRSKDEYQTFLEQVEKQKAQGPPKLSERAKRDLPQHVQEQHFNPDYHSILTAKMRLCNGNDEPAKCKRAKKLATDFQMKSK